MKLTYIKNGCLEKRKDKDYKKMDQRFQINNPALDRAKRILKTIYEVQKNGKSHYTAV